MAQATKKKPVLAPDGHQNLLHFFENYGILQELFEVKNDFMEALYALAHQMYISNKYKQAEQMFALLCLFNHYERKYWLGLGATRQMLKKYDAALEAYVYAAILDYKDPDAQLHAGECMLALGDRQKAKNIFRQVVELCVGPAHSAMKEKAKRLLEILK